MIYFLEFLIGVLVVVGTITQVMLPIAFGTRLFPLLRRRELIRQHVAAKDKLERQQLWQQVQDLYKEAKGKQ